MQPSAEEDARAALIVRLRRENRYDLAARLEKCGQPLTLICQDCTKLREVRTRCDCKWCPCCQRAMAARTAARYATIAAECQWPLFVTFTVQHSERDEVELLRDVRRSHTKLRRLRWWKRCVRGGVVAYEVTRGKHGWHPHAHALIDCRWLTVTTTAPPIGAPRPEWTRRGKASTSEVAEQWRTCLSRSGTVKVRRCWADDNGGIQGAVHEVLKYSVKGNDLVEMDGEIAALIDVLDRTRLVASWGTFYRHPAVKRQRSAPAMCSCGACAWIPETVFADRTSNAARKYR